MFWDSRCKLCGTPRYTRIFRRWNDDGTVTGRRSPGMRLCHLEAGEIEAVVGGISRQIGFDIDPIVAEGQRRATRSITDEVFDSLPGSGRFARSRLGSGLSIRVIMDIGRTAGHGLPCLVEQDRGRLLRVAVHHPFSVPMVVGDLWGSFEAIFNVNARADWRARSDELTITLVTERKGTVWESLDRLALQKQPTIPGTAGFERCPACGVPVEVTRTIMWDLENGIVSNRITGRREASITVESWNAVIRELANELGEEVFDMVRRCEQRYAADTIASETRREGRGRDALLCHIEEMRVLGMGNPVKLRRGGRLLEVRVENPFCAPFLAGRVAGCYEAYNQVPAEARWTPDDDGFTDITVYPA